MKNFVLLILLWWLILWNGSGEFRPGMDSMTYGALAKNILKTGDWNVLHYSEQAYSDFFQSPPLMIWLMALFFSVFGASDLTLKILPNLMALATVAGVVLWGGLISRHASNPRAASAGLAVPWAGFVAGFVLLASVRYTKYSVGLMLDVPLAFFLTWAGLFLVLSFSSSREGFLGKSALRPWFPVLSGLCFALAFLSKGMPALVFIGVFAVLSFSALLLVPKSERMLPGAFFLNSLKVGIGAGLIFALWFGFADGDRYLQRYWSDSVRARMGGATWDSHFAPIFNLMKVYWPWLPFFIWGAYKAFGKAYQRVSGVGVFQRLGRALLQPQGVAVLFSCAIVTGFILGGHFLEHYMVPFYPFAAVVVSSAVAPWLEKKAQPILRWLWGVALVYACLLAALPIHVQGKEYLNPVRILLKRAAAECGRPGVEGAQPRPVRSLHISTDVADLWWGLAVGLWYTPWETQVSPIGKIQATSDDALLLHRGVLREPTREAHAKRWVPTALHFEDWVIYEREGALRCPQEPARGH